jgi:hypothetical protein
MTTRLTPEELALFANIPEADLVEFAVDLDLAFPEVVDRRAILEEAIAALARVARTRGLPLSDYDRDDLEALPGAHLRALANLCGAPQTVDGLLKAGRKSYKAYKGNLMSPIPMMVPMLLGPLARYAAEES